MTYTVSSGTLNSTIPYHTIPQDQLESMCCVLFVSYLLVLCLYTRASVYLAVTPRSQPAIATTACHESSVDQGESRRTADAEQPCSSGTCRAAAVRPSTTAKEMTGACLAPMSMCYCLCLLAFV